MSCMSAGNELQSNEMKAIRFGVKKDTQSPIGLTKKL